MGLSVVIVNYETFELTKNAVNTLEGERIYDSEGHLNSIVRDGDKIKTIYKMSKDDEGMIESIKTVSKKTGKPIMTQENEIVDGKYKSMFITEFSPLSAKVVASTVYEDGKAVYANKTKYIVRIESKDTGATIHIHLDTQEELELIEEMSK